MSGPEEQVFWLFMRLGSVLLNMYVQGCLGRLSGSLSKATPLVEVRESTRRLSRPSVCCPFLHGTKYVPSFVYATPKRQVYLLQHTGVWIILVFLQSRRLFHRCHRFRLVPTPPPAYVTTHNLKNETDVLRVVPDSRVLIETDRRAATNGAVELLRVCGAIAEAKGISMDEAVGLANGNAARFLAGVS